MRTVDEYGLHRDVGYDELGGALQAGWIERESRLQPGKRTAHKRLPIDEDVRWAIYERDDFTCQECGSRRRLTVDHIAPVSRGGGNEPTNLRTLCGSCNSRKGARL